MELETLNENLQRQLRHHEDTEVKRKSQLENLILINNRLTLDNAALKKEIEQFRQQGNELVEDLNQVKRLYETICRKVEAMGQQNQKLHEQIAKQRIDIDTYLDDIAFTKKELEEVSRKNQQLTMTMRHMKSSHKRQELSILEQSVNERVSSIYNIDKSIETQHELKQRIQLLEEAIEKQSKLAPQTNRSKRQFIKKLQKIHDYFSQLKRKVNNRITTEKNIEKLQRFTVATLEGIVAFIEKEIVELRQ